MQSVIFCIVCTVSYSLLGMENKVGTKIEKYGTVINVEINVAVIFSLPDKCCNKILLDWFSRGWGFSRVTLTKDLLFYEIISLLFFMCISAATDLVFQCFIFKVVGFYACEVFFYLMTVKSKIWV